jgi:periplasmic divalent cation tolerance protein
MPCHPTVSTGQEANAATCPAYSASPLTCAAPLKCICQTRQLVSDGLCASAHNFTPVRSVYRWQAEVHERIEGRASLHTRKSRVAEIVARVKSQHPYDVPGVSTRPIEDGNPEYLAWMLSETEMR